MFEPKKDDNGEWRRIHNEELHSLFYSRNILRVIKSRGLRWAGHVAKLKKGVSASKTLTAEPIGKRRLGKKKTTLNLQK